MESNSTEHLSAIAETRAAVADRLITPWWYHPALGVLAAGYLLALGLGSIAIMLAGGVLFIVGAGALASAYRRLTGIWISGFDAGGTASRWAKAIGGMVGVSAVASYFIGHYTDLRWPVWCIAVLGFAACLLLGNRFDTALRAQLRAGA